MTYVILLDLDKIDLETLNLALRWGCNNPHKLPRLSRSKIIYCLRLGNLLYVKHGYLANKTAEVYIAKTRMIPSKGLANKLLMINTEKKATTVPITNCP